MHAHALPRATGTLQRLPRIVHNDSWVREVCLTGRRFGAAEALRHGLVGEVVAGGQGAVLGRALHLARTIAAKSIVAVCGIK
jgi:delta(3,5)-delta(2,4)-dienoyl-CoA isomerase